jgi:hypothetical protein
MTIRQRILALAGAAVGLPLSGCSAPPAPVAHRGTPAPTSPLHPLTPADEATTTSTVPPTTTTTPAPVTTVTIAGLPPTTTARRTTTTFTVPERTDEDVSDETWAERERILACIRSYEGGYATATGNGHWGAYQFVQSTWDGAAARAGHRAWVGRRASDAPAHVQDDVAWQLYTELGFQPWPPATRYCRG